MRASDRALTKELQAVASTLTDARQRSAVHAAIQRLRQLSRGEPAPKRITTLPPVTLATQRATVPAAKERC